MTSRTKGNHASAESQRNDYAVGYGRPPRHSQFRPGRSGNPSGRRKGSRNLKTDVQRTLKLQIKVNEGGRARKISTQEGALLLLREKALNGDPRALDRLLELAGRYNCELTEASTQPLPAEDQEILAAYVAKSTAASATSAEKKGPGYPVLKLRQTSRSGGPE